MSKKRMAILSVTHTVTSTSPSSSSSSEERTPSPGYCCRVLPLTEFFAFTSHVFKSLKNNLSVSSGDPFLVKCVFILVVTIIAYWPSLSAELVFDDRPAIIENQDVRPSTALHQLFLNDFWGRRLTDIYSHKSYRPLTVLSFRINFWIHGLDAFGFHLVNVMLHALASVLFFRLANLLLSDHAFITTLLFALHPIHTDAVASVVGRAELLSAISFLICLLLQLQSHHGNHQGSRLKAVESCVNNNYIVQKRQDKVQGGRNSSAGWSICYKTVMTILLSLTGFLCKEQSLIVLLISSLNHFLLCYSGSLSRNNKRHESISPSRIKFMQAYSQQQQQQQPAVDANGCSRGSVAGSRRNKRSGSSSSATDSSPSDSPILKCRVWRTAAVQPVGGKKINLKPCLCFLAAFAAALAARFALSGGSLSPTFNRFDNPASVEPAQTQLLTYGFLSAFNFGLLLLPVRLSCDWTHSSLPVIDSLFQADNLVTLTFYSALLAFLLSLCLLLNHRQRQSSDYARQVILASSIVILCYVPSSNLFFRTGFVIAERTLYLPSIGSSLLIGFGLKNLGSGVKHWVKHHVAFCCVPRILTSIVIVSFALRTYDRCKDWRDEESLFSAGLKVNPWNVKLLNNMARIEESRQNVHAAIAYYRTALQIEKQSLRTFMNLGNLYSRLGKLREAESVFLKAKELVQEEFYQQKRTSRLQVTTLTRLLHLLSRDVGADEPQPVLAEHEASSIDRHQEAQEVQRLLNILSSAEASSGHVTSQQMNRRA